MSRMSWMSLPDARHVPVVTVTSVHLAVATALGRVQDMGNSHQSQIGFIFGRRTVKDIFFRFITTIYILIEFYFRAYASPM